MVRIREGEASEDFQLWLLNYAFPEPFQQEILPCNVHLRLMEDPSPRVPQGSVNCTDRLSIKYQKPMNQTL